MTRIILGAFVIALVGTAVEAAPRQQGRNPNSAFSSAPVGLQGGFPTRPAWAAPGECFTDDGYGRFRSCSAGGRS